MSPAFQKLLQCHCEEFIHSFIREISPESLGNQLATVSYSLLNQGQFSSGMKTGKKMWVLLFTLLSFLTEVRGERITPFCAPLRDLSMSLGSPYRSTSRSAAEAPCVGRGSPMHVVFAPLLGHIPTGLGLEHFLT